jgi:hypothetical protein
MQLNIQANSIFFCKNVSGPNSQTPVLLLQTQTCVQMQAYFVEGKCDRGRVWTAASASRLPPLDLVSSASETSDTDGAVERTQNAEIGHAALQMRGRQSPLQAPSVCPSLPGVQLDLCAEGPEISGPEISGPKSPSYARCVVHHGDLLMNLVMLPRNCQAREIIEGYHMFD